MANTHIHEGSYESIPADSSSGLLFLKRILPAMDAMEPPFDLGSHFTDPNATLTINDSPSVTVTQVTAMLEMRSKGLTKFHHKLHKAWDVESQHGDHGQVTRTVMFESTSVTVFARDPAQTKVEVKEFSIIELKQVSGDELKATSIRTFMDARAVESLVAKLQNSVKEDTDVLPP